MTDHGFEPASLLDRIVVATEQVLDTAARFGDADVRERSLLPHWSRAHVLTHLARNADGGRRLLIWARTDVEGYEYRSVEARAAEIEAGADRSAAELLADVRDSSTRFAAEYARMSAAAWERMVRWTGGKEHPAARAADSRLCEVLVHHVDLRADFTSADWPADFTADMLGKVMASFAAHRETAAMRLHASDTGVTYDVRADTEAAVIRGPQTALLAWLMGRSDGDDLITEDGRALPPVPFLY
jgi:maleylpyruvate isomerase